MRQGAVMANDKRGPWTVASKQEIYDNEWIRVSHYAVETPRGGQGIYGSVHYKHFAIGIVPVDTEGYTFLVGQFRFPINRYTWEIPEGGGPLGIDPLESAARELAEETGLMARGWHQLLCCDLSNSVSDERAIAFLAWDLTQGQASPEPTEELEIRRLPLTEAFRMVASGAIDDALSVVSLQAVQLLYQDNRLPKGLPIVR